MYKLLVILLITGCAQDVIPIGPIDRSTKEILYYTAQVYSAWPLGTTFYLDVQESFLCVPELEEVVAYWESLGLHFDKQPTRASKIIPVDSGYVDGMIGRYQNTRHESTGLRVAGSVTMAYCDTIAIAHEIGHMVGFSHTSRQGALMYPSNKYAGWDVNDTELAKISYLLRD